MEPAPNHTSGPDVPNLDSHIPTTPFFNRPAPYSCRSEPPVPLHHSAHPLALRRNFWENAQPVEQQPIVQLPTPPSLWLRRGRRVLLPRSTSTVSGPTLAGILIDREDTPPDLRSINSILNGPDPYQQTTARPLLPTPRTSSWPPDHFTPLTAFNFAREVIHESEASTPRGASSGRDGSSISPRTPYPCPPDPRSPFSRRNAIPDIRSPITPATTDSEHEAPASHISSRAEQAIDNNSNDLVAMPSQPSMKAERPRYRPSRFVEHLDISAPPEYFDQTQMNRRDDSGYDGDDEKSA